VLELKGISASYGAVRALENVSLGVPAGGIVCLLGANGAGKTTTLNCISGVVPLTAGAIHFEGDLISGQPIDRIVARGIVQVPEGREIFPELTVADNLLLGTWLRRRQHAAAKSFERVYDYFPRLQERAQQLAGTLSGGEQQMLMIGRALMAQPKLLLLDEPSLGLAPVIVDRIYEVVRELNGQGVTILLVEQNANYALDVSARGYVLETGTIALTDTSSNLRNDKRVQDAYLGT
jgi:branched-chain amino acid transport system ATP-binding protein